MDEGGSQSGHQKRSERLWEGPGTFVRADAHQDSGLERRNRAVIVEEGSWKPCVGRRRRVADEWDRGEMS